MSIIPCEKLFLTLEFGMTPSTQDESKAKARIIHVSSSHCWLGARSRDDGLNRKQYNLLFTPKLEGCGQELLSFPIGTILENQWLTYSYRIVSITVPGSLTPFLSIAMEQASELVNAAAPLREVRHLKIS